MGTFSDRFASGRHIVEIPGNGITTSGIVEIDKLLNEYDVLLPTDWLWVWRVGGKGEYVGTLPKRVGKYAHKQGHKLTPEVLSKVGNLGSDHCEKTETYNFEFVDKFDWSAGDFGDEGSCFWSCHASAKDMLLDNGAGAVCFYQRKHVMEGHLTGDHPFWVTTSKGIARAWIIPQPDDCFIVFNGYGIETLPIARILATYFGHAYYRKIDLNNRGYTDGNLWVNGGSGYLVGPQDVVQGVDKVSLDWDGSNSLLCTNCECEIDEDDHCHDPDDEDLCSDCYSKQVFFCESCNEDCWTSDKRIDPDENPICRSCSSESVAYCDSCEEDYWANKSMKNPDGENHCHDCHSSKVVICNECRKKIWKADAIEGGVPDCCGDHIEVSWCGDCYGIPALEESTA